MTEFATPAQPSALAIFRNRNFTLMFSAQLMTQLGAAVTSLAASLYIYRATRSAFAVGLIIMAAYAPSLLLGLVAGVFVDRLDRRRLMITANLVRAGLMLALPLLLPSNVLWLYALVALSAGVDQFYRPAHASLLADVTSESEFNAANAFMSVSLYGAMALGTLLAGSLAALARLEWAFYLNALTFLIAALLEARLRPAAPPPAEPSDVNSVFSNLRAGFKVITGTQALRSLFFTFFVASAVFGLIWAIHLPFAVQALGATEFDYGLLESLYPIGMVAGSLAMARLGDRLGAGQWIAISLLGVGLTMLAFGLSRSVPPALLITLLEGMIYAPAVVAQTVVIQRHTPRAARGRVFSAFFVMVDSLFLVGLAAGGLADVLDIRLLYVAGAGAALLIGGAALVLPGLGRPAAEWRRALYLLRTAPQAPGLGLELGRRLLPSDFTRLTSLLPALARLAPDQQQRLSAAMSLHAVPAGTAVIRMGEASDRAFFILEGQAVAGRAEAESYRTLEVLRRGDFFGEIAALTGRPRMANVVTDQATTLVRVPAASLRELALVPELHSLFHTRMAERLSQLSPTDLARPCAMDQEALRELRTPAADLAAE